MKTIWLITALPCPEKNSITLKKEIKITINKSRK